MDTDRTHSDAERDTRRRFLAATATLGTAGLAGCSGLLGGGDDAGNGNGDGNGNGETDGQDTASDGVGQIGSGREGREQQGGTPMSEMPDLSGELTVYSGRNEFLVGDLVEFVEGLYDDFSLSVRYGGSADLVNQIVTEGDGTPADVFYSVNSGSLGALADEGRTGSLPSDVLDLVRAEFHTDNWVGTSGRARSVPYNTNTFSEEDIPDDIMEFPDFDADMGWAPTYGSNQAFVTAMRILEGEEATREWLEAMVESGIQAYPDEFVAAQAVADGEIDAAFTNHYYIQRVLDPNPDAPLAGTFTEGDAGSIFNVAGAAVVDAADDAELARNFVLHLLSTEAQDYFARTTFEYPLVPGVNPIGDLPPIDELDVPDIDLAQLSDLEPTIDMMRGAGAEI